MEKDLRCFTLHLFFRVEGAALYGGDTGYVELKFGYCQNIESLSDSSRYDETAEEARRSVAKQLGIDPQNVFLISYNEYKENTDDDEDAPDLLDDDDQLAWMAGDNDA